MGWCRKRELGKGGEEVSAIIFADAAGDAGDANTDFLGYTRIISLSHTHTHITHTHTHTHAHTHEGAGGQKRVSRRKRKTFDVTSKVQANHRKWSAFDEVLHNALQGIATRQK